MIASAGMGKTHVGKSKGALVESTPRKKALKKYNLPGKKTTKKQGKNDLKTPLSRLIPMNNSNILYVFQPVKAST